MHKIYLTFLFPLFLGGCMITGMGGMGHMGGMNEGSQGSSMKGQTIVKESVVDGIKITVELPPYTLADELIYKVNLYDVRDKLTISDASISLIIIPDNSQSQDSHNDHSEMQEMKFSPVEINNGIYIFRPVIKMKGTYNLTFVLERIGSSELNPPIEVEQTIQLSNQMDMRSEDADNMGVSGISPIVLIGAGAMVIMMLFMFRWF